MHYIVYRNESEGLLGQRPVLATNERERAFTYAAGEPDVLVRCFASSERNEPTLEIWTTTERGHFIRTYSRDHRDLLDHHEAEAHSRIPARLG